MPAGISYAWHRATGEASRKQIQSVTKTFSIDVFESEVIFKK